MITWSRILKAVEMEMDKTERYLTKKNVNYLGVGDKRKIRYQGLFLDFMYV